VVMNKRLTIVKENVEICSSICFSIRLVQGKRIESIDLDSSVEVLFGTGYFM
jgi:hypothetical protein